MRFGFAVMRVLVGWLNDEINAVDFEVAELGRCCVSTGADNDFSGSDSRFLICDSPVQFCVVMKPGGSLWNWKKR